jgi:hypothetical protein
MRADLNAVRLSLVREADPFDLAAQTIVDTLRRK